MELSKTRAGVFASLANVKMRRKHGLFVVEGLKSVVEMIGHYRLEALICLPEMAGDIRTDSRMADVSSDKIFTAPVSVINKISTLSTTASSPLLAVFHLPEDSLEFASNRLPDDLYLLLDGVRDPGNLGTIIRTAHWFGIKRIFASPDCADCFNSKTLQSAMGSLPHVRISYCDLPELVSQNPELPVYGLLLDGKNIYNTRLDKKGFIVMGNEGRGLSEAMRTRVTHPLLIPPYNPASHPESLNVAIATAVTLSIFRHQ